MNSRSFEYCYRKRNRNILRSEAFIIKNAEP